MLSKFFNACLDYVTSTAESVLYIKMALNLPGFCPFMHPSFQGRILDFMKEFNTF